MSEQANFDDYIRKCIRCSFCQPVCPLFAELREEGVLARAKVRLAGEFVTGKLTPASRLKELFSLCLDCRACESACPAHIPVHQVVKSMRDALRHVSGSGRGMYRAAAVLLTRPRLVRRLAILAALSKGNSSRLRIPKPVSKLAPTAAKAGQIFRAPAKTPFAAGLKPYTPSRSAGSSIGYFVGCATNYFYPETGKAVLKVLHKLNLAVFTPSLPICCGLPLLNGGEHEAARRLAARVIKQFANAEPDVIVTDCAGCSLHLKEYANLWPDLPGAKDFSAKVIDISAFLVQRGLGKGPKGVSKKVTYHDPCHLGRAQSIKNEPRQVLAQISGLELVEMQDSDRCCGGSGLFSLTHPELSERILARKLKTIEDTTARIVVTSCPSCRIQLERGIDSKQLDQVLHPVELLAQTWPGEDV